MADLFAGFEPAAPPETIAENAPLADRLRPRQLADVVGQDHITGPDGAIGRMVAAGRLSSMILWGPPGTGKTTIARLLADAVDLRFVAISAVFSGVADLKKAFAEAREHARIGKRTLLFVDEIHRFNRAQQDGFLPYVEDGTVTLVGATTENPSFELNAALLSRAQVLILERLGRAALEQLLERADAVMERPLPLTPPARDALIASADGDGRFLLNQAETLFSVDLAEPLDPAGLSAFLQRRVAVYDKDREGHYNLISALHKSIRGSDPQAALYYLARMLTAGEEPLYLLRRLTRAAVEDIGLADPQALVQCIAAKDTYDFLGSPEGELAIAQACLYLATAPKSNAVYAAQKAAWRSAKETGSLMPPANILNAPTKLMRDIGYGKGYAYDHDEADGFSGANYWPDELPPQRFYEPTDRGYEKRVRERLAWWDARRGGGDRTITPDRFTHFAAIDWSGAKGTRHRGIAVAICATGSAAPVLVDPPDRLWSRRGVLDWLIDNRGTALLVGFDFSFSAPFVQRGAHLPGEPDTADARALWAFVDADSDDADLGAASFIERRRGSHFYLGKRDGEKAGFLHYRACEQAGKPSTVYDAIGAAQVAKASFAGMRLLHHLNGRIPIWPFDPLPARGAAILEIYTAIAARAAGMRKGISKIRDAASLDVALAALGSKPHAALARYDDHATDAILTAAWLRTAVHRDDLWNPAALTPTIAATEGWTFGVA